MSKRQTATDQGRFEHAQPASTSSLGYDALPSHVDAERYTCTSCRLLLRRPMQAPCGDRLCSPCASRLLLQGSSSTALCPACRIPFTKTELFHDMFAEREILALEVSCGASRQPDSSCGWKGELRHLEEHERSCPHCMVRCCSCRLMVKRADMEGHLSTVCPKRQVACQSCGSTMAADSEQKHITEDCEEVQVTCSNMCEVKLPRKLLKEHLKTCPRQVVSCYYSPIACTFQGERQALPQHHSECLQYHMQLQFQSCQTWQAQVCELSKTNDTLMTKCLALERTVTRLTEMCEELQACLHPRNERRPGDYCGQASLPKLLKGEKRSDELAFIGESFPSELALTTSMSVSQRQHKHLSGSGEDHWSSDDVEKRLESAEWRLTAVDRTLALHDTLLTDLSIRQDIADIKTSSGVLVWKLADFARRQREAQSGKTTSLLSPPFYTSPCGYRLCARVYLNGDGLGKGSHVSLFLVVMKGEFDSLLPWPFAQHVTLCLLDQGTNARHVVESFRPNSRSSSFQRPQSEMNIASGCPLFVPLAALNDRYVKDDTVFFKIVVQRTGLVAPDDPRL